MDSTHVKTAAFCVVAAAVLFSRASGQSIPSPYRFIDTNRAGSVYAGYLFTGKGNLNLGPGSGPLYGARFDIQLSGPFAIEADVGYFSAMRAVYDTVPGDTTRALAGESPFTTLLLGGALRFNLTGPRTYHHVQPFVLFGGGLALDLSNASADDKALPTNVRFNFGTSFTGMLGGGAEILLGDRSSLRLDLRNLLWKLETPQAFLIKADQALLLPGKEWAQNFSLSAGLSFRF